MFIDRAKIYVREGNGGKGCNSFYRDKLTRHGRADGGDGGKGGDVIIRAEEGIQTLLDFQYRRYFRASSGGHGSSKNKRGRQGIDCIIKVPIGTVIQDGGTLYQVADLTAVGEEVIVARGGRGGRGNTGTKPAEDGELGEEKELILQLKLIADVGIIGYPNVGKSTLVNRISEAKSKVASYPFTTKAPVLGVVGREGGESFIIADLPGLIDGAHMGKGLGHQFLRHIERTSVLVHLIDMAAVEGRDPVSDYKSLNQELEFYGQNLIEKPQIVAANKMDLPPAARNLARFRSKVSKKIYPISCTSGEGLKGLIDVIFSCLSKLKERL